MIAPRAPWRGMGEVVGSTVPRGTPRDRRAPSSEARALGDPGGPWFGSIAGATAVAVLAQALPVDDHERQADAEEVLGGYSLRPRPSGYVVRHPPSIWQGMLAQRCRDDQFRRTPI